MLRRGTLVMLVAALASAPAVAGAQTSGQAVVEGSGCAASADVSVIRIDSGVRVGQDLSDIAGDFKIPVDVPAAELATTRLQARCLGRNGSILTIPLGAAAATQSDEESTTVTTSASSDTDDEVAVDDLARTGPVAWAWLAAGGIVAVNSGLGMMRVLRLRREQDEDDLLV